MGYFKDGKPNGKGERVEGEEGADERRGKGVNGCPLRETER